MCVPFSGEFVGDGVNNQGGHSGEHDGGGDDGYVGQSVEEEAGGVVLAGGFLLSLVTGGDVGFGAGGVDVDGGGAEGGERSDTSLVALVVFGEGVGSPFNAHDVDSFVGCGFVDDCPEVRV